MLSDYYRTLGVDWDATLDQIKSAYRRKAKKLHPDRYAGGSDPFRAVQEAYEVLCDPVRRKDYDADLALMRKARPTSSNPGPEPFRHGHCPVEPMVSPHRSHRSWEPPFDAAFNALLQEIFGREWLRTGLSGRPETVSVEGLQIDVHLTPHQARLGGCIRISVPVRLRCPTCHGYGRSTYFLCRDCSGSGVVMGEHPIEFDFPPGMVDGLTGTLSLDKWGMPNKDLTIHFRVDRW